MNATANATVLDTLNRRRDLITWAVRNLNARKEAFDAPEYANLTADELRPVIATMAEEAGIDIEVHDDAPQWKLTLDVLPLRQLGHNCFLGSIKYRDVHMITVPERAQRVLKPSRVPKIANYIIDCDGRTDEKGKVHAGYFPSVVINIRGEDIEVATHTINVGENAVLEAMEGQHRDAGIVKSIELGLTPDRLDDDLPCLFYVNLTLDEQRQAFADINANLVKPPKAINIAYSQRNMSDELAKEVATTVFGDKVAANKTRISVTDPEWFTLTSVVDAVNAMYDIPVTPDTYEQRLEQACEYWRNVAQEMAPVWADKSMIANNKNCLVAIGKQFGDEVDFAALACLDWTEGGPIHTIIKTKGGTNAAVNGVYAYLAERVVKEKAE